MSSTEYDVLVVSAHPDDAEMAMGGTMIRLTEAGYRLLHVSLTSAQKSTYGTPETRREEFKQACKIIGCDGKILGFEDTELENDTAARKEVIQLIRMHKPKIVFAPYHTNPLGELAGIANVDHYTAGALVRDAAKLARHQKVVPEVARHEIDKLYFYLVPRDVWAPLTVDVSGVIDQTLAAIRAYKSQLEISFRGTEIEHLLLTMRATAGIGIGAKYAEAFCSDLALRFEAETFFKV